MDLENLTLEQTRTAIQEEWHCKLGDNMKVMLLGLVDRIESAESKLAAMESQAAKLITQACCNAVEKLNEIAPDKGWDSGEVVAEMYIRQLSAKPVPADKPVVAVPECFKKLYDHARGIRFGTDWNNGTAARYHRQPLIDAALDCEKWLATAPSHSQQSAVIDFKGHCVVRADITLHPLVMIRRANFIECYIDDSLVRKEKVMDNCILKECSIRSEWPDRCPSHESEQGGGK